MKTRIPDEKSWQEGQEQLTQLLVRIPKDIHEALRAYSSITGTTMSDATARSLMDFLAGSGREEQVEASVERARTRYRVALDKLADL